ERIARGVGQAGVLLFLRMRDELVAPRGNPGREGQGDHTVVGGDVGAARGKGWLGGSKGRRGDVLRLVDLVRSRVEDQGVVADVRGGRRVDGREEDLRG